MDTIDRGAIASAAEHDGDIEKGALHRTGNCPSLSFFSL